MDISKLDLSEKDFDMIIEGLEALPEKDTAGFMMSSLLGAVLTKGDENSSEFDRKMEAKKRDHEREKALIKEEVRILQGKMINLKRWFRENELLSETNNILKK